MYTSKISFYSPITLVFLIFLSLFNPQPLVTVQAEANIIRVVPNGLKTPDCGSDWTNACDLQHALRTRVNTTNGSTWEIWVKSGTYYPGGTRDETFHLKNGVAIYGGFLGTETIRDQRNWETNATILSGDREENDLASPITNLSQMVGVNTSHVVTGSGMNATAILDGFTVTAGQSYYDYGYGCGGGIYNDNGSPILRNLIVTGNASYVNPAYPSGIAAGICNIHFSNPVLMNVIVSNNSGGGLGNDNGCLTITHSKFENNIGSGISNGVEGNLSLNDVTFDSNKSESGAGLMDFGTSMLTDVVFSNNVAQTYDGGGMVTYGYAIFNRVVFSNNSAIYGGGLSINSSYPYLGEAILTNVTFVDNDAGDAGGGIYISSSMPVTLTNVTLYNNVSTSGGGIYSTANTLIRNSIVWGNSPNIFLENATVIYSDIQNSNEVYPGEGNINLDPMLGTIGVYSDTLILPVLPGSPVIDTANPDYCPSTDQRGVTRPQVNGCDMGAYEARPLTLSRVSGDQQDTLVDTPFTIPLVVKLSSDYGEPVDGGQVIFSTPATGASAMLSANPSTIVDGLASVTASANNIGGGYFVTANVGSAYANFRLRNLKLSNTALSSSSGTAVVGQTVTLAATVTALNPYTGTVSDGTVTFYAETTKLQEVPVNSQGIAIYSFNDNLTVGDHSLVAVYNGSDSFRTSSSASLIHSVYPGATALELISAPIPSAFGQPVTFTAIVSSIPPAIGVPSGNITFTVDGLKSVIVPLNQDGNAVYTVNDLKPGVYDVQAAYGGESRFLNSISPIVHHTVLSGTVTTSLSSSSNPLDLGQSVTLTVTVKPNLPATDIPTGKVTIRMGDVDLQILDLDINGTAVYTVTNLQPGTYNYSAAYLGDSNFESATSPILTQVILKGTTVVTSISSPTPSKFGEDITIAAEIGTTNIYNVNPTGYVTFTLGSLSPKVVELDQDGKAQYIAKNLHPDKYNISVVYSGDDNFSSSTEPTFTHTVLPGAVRVNLYSVPSSSKPDQPITFTARVIPNLPATELPTGKVTFVINNTDQQTVDLSQEGTAVYTVTNLLPGTYDVVAEYSGDMNYSNSTSSIWTQFVDWIRCFLPVVVR